MRSTLARSWTYYALRFPTDRNTSQPTSPASSSRYKRTAKTPYGKLSLLHWGKPGQRLPRCLGCPKAEKCQLSHPTTYSLRLQDVYEFHPRKDKRDFDLISDALPFFFPELRSAVFRRTSWKEAPTCFPTNENVFALLRVARIIFESQMANDAAP